MMRRRELITLAGGAAVTWSLSALAQQRAMPVIGLLSSRSLDDSRHMMAAFVQGLREQGYVEHQNVKIETLFAEGHYDRRRCSRVPTRSSSEVTRPARRRAIGSALCRSSSRLQRI
jgi:hypothetical protein